MLDLDKYGTVVDSVLDYIKEHRPCECGDPGCPVEYFDAEAIVELMVESLAL
jgi:hypothetical protein